MMLQAGFGRVDVSPEYPVHLQGSDWRNRISTCVLEPVMVTCVALRREALTVLFYTMDIKLMIGPFVAPLKARVSQATGVPEENIFLQGTHTHAGPAVRYPWEGVEAYHETLIQGAVRAGVDAVADLAGATVRAGSTQMEGMIHVRHYRMNDGTVAGSAFGSFASGEKEHVRQADQQIQLVRFCRADKKDILLMSYPCHATFHGNTNAVSADFPGPARRYIEAHADVLVAYFIGAGGDQVPRSRIPGLSYSDDYAEYGQRVGRYAMDALDSLTPVAEGPLKLLGETVCYPTNKMPQERMEQANIVRSIEGQYGRRSPELKQALKDYHFHSIYQANYVYRFSTLPDTRQIPLRVVTVGPLGFVIAPYEMFGQQGRYIREHSPCQLTMIMTCSEGDHSYLPSKEAFDYDCYESHCCFYARGTAEALAKDYVSMLEKLQ